MGIPKNSDNRNSVTVAAQPTTGLFLRRKLFKQLPSGYWLMQGEGPCNWAQKPKWPCRAKVLLDHTFQEAGEAFIAEMMKMASDLFDEEPFKSEVEDDFNYFKELYTRKVTKVTK